MSDITVLLKLKIQTLLERLALGAEYLIKNRTAEGKDSNLSEFEPYSPAYKLVRSKAGLPAQPVSMFYSGDMLGQITHEIASFDPNSVEIFFRTKRAEDLAFYHNISGAGKSGTKRPGRVIRQFFALSDSDIEQLMKLADDSVNEFAEEIGTDIIQDMLINLRNKNVTN